MKPLTDIAWAAGLFEGEGSIVITSPERSANRCSGQVHVTLHMTDYDVVERFAQMIGVGRCLSMPRKGRPAHYKPTWRWSVTGAKARIALRELAPYLGKRRSTKATEALVLLDRAFAERACPICQQSFEPDHGNRKYCSQTCSYKSRLIGYTNDTDESLQPE